MAKTTDWGLTDAGFRRPTYAELLDALEYKARELFGSKANLTVRSPLGGNSKKTLSREIGDRVVLAAVRECHRCRVALVDLCRAVKAVKAQR